VAAYEEALRHDPSNVRALTNLQTMAAASGHRDAADAYRRRLEAVTPGGKGGTPAGNPGAAAPTWPVASGTGRSLPWDPAHDDAAPMKLQPPRDEDVEAMRELLRDLPSVTVERRGGQLTLLGWTRAKRRRTR
jgi:hypothetical protein